MLKYRFRHIARLDAEIELIDKLVLGAAFNYYSYMDNVDQFFVSYIDGLEQYRLEHNSGDLVIDTRAAFKITPKSKITLVIENILNREYSLRPAKVDAPRNYTLQYQMTF